ncbi:MAG: HlyC/CorC family transporter [Planctomycetes bacterium]|nr:HlyC/CorC family transporter [Planctomycetota bacterium]
MWGEFLAARAGQLALLAGLLCLSAFFSGSETALFSLSPGQLYRLGRSGGGGRRAAELMNRPHEILQVLLLSNLVVNVAYSGISAVLVLDFRRAAGLASWYLAVLSAVPVLALILAGEVLPKMLAMLAAERWATAAGGVLSVLRRSLRVPIAFMHAWIILPLTRMLAPGKAERTQISAEELAAVLELSARRGMLDSRTSVLLREIVGLTELRVADIMVPRVDMICYDVDGPRGGLVKLLARTRLRRVPVYERDVDHILGIVHAKRVLFRPGASLRELVSPVPFVPEAASVERVLTQLRARRSQMAIVVDEYGGTAGLVTLEDILEEIVGDIPDRHEDASGPAVEQVGPGRYVIDGNLPIHEWDEAFGMDLDRRRISSVGGFVTSLLGRIPAVGDEAAYRNLTFKVISMRRRRIGKLELTVREGER